MNELHFYCIASLLTEAESQGTFCQRVLIKFSVLYFRIRKNQPEMDLYMALCWFGDIMGFYLLQNQFLVLTHATITWRGPTLEIKTWCRKCPLL